MIEFNLLIFLLIPSPELNRNLRRSVSSHSTPGRDGYYVIVKVRIDPGLSNEYEGRS